MSATRLLGHGARSPIASCSHHASSSLTSAALPASASARPFTSSSVARESKGKRKSRLIRKANLEKKRSLEEAHKQSKPDPITGFAKGNEHVWDSSLLKSILLSREQVWGPVKQPDQFGEDESDLSVDVQESVTNGTSTADIKVDVPELLNFGVTREEAEKLAHSMPLVSARRDFWQQDVARAGTGGSGDVIANRVEQAEEDELAKRDRLLRIIDLKNANAQGIHFVNTRRIVETFGRRAGRAPTTSATDTPEQQEERPNSGLPEVQAAILTTKIRALLDHLIAQPRDVQNQRALRMAVHKRANTLRYLRSVDVKRYDDCLRDIGVEPRAVEGEVIVSKETLRQHIRPS